MKPVNKNRAQVREKVREDVLNWYVMAAGRPPLEQCETKKGHEIVWFLDPPIPGDNYVVVECDVQDVWSIRIAKRIINVSVFVP